MKRGIIILTIICSMLCVLSCSDFVSNFEDTHKRSNPYDSKYNGPTGKIFGKAILDQRPLTSNIQVELRLSADVPSQFLEIKYRNTMPDNWNESELPSTVCTTQTDNQGNFSFDKIPMGTYVLRVSYTGYNSAWVANIHITENAQVTLPDPVTLTERIEGKILFLSNRDGFTEFYQMNSDGTEQERLTFNGIHGWEDDDEFITDLDYNEDTNQIIFRRTSNDFIYLFNYTSRTVTDSIIIPEIYISTLCWGTGNTIYLAGDDDQGTGIWKINSISNPSPNLIYRANDDISYMDVSETGKISFIEDAWLYRIDNDYFLFAQEEYGPVAVFQADGTYMALYSDLTEMRQYYPLHSLIPVSQIKIIENDDAQSTRVQYTSTVEDMYPHMYEIPDAFGWGDELGLPSNLVVYQMGDGDIFAYDMWDLGWNCSRANSVWGVQWSPDESKITFCDLFGTGMGYEITYLIEDPPGTFKENDRYHNEWSFWFNVSIQTIDPSAPEFIGWMTNDPSYNYAYDSLLNLSTAQPHWSSDGKKIVFVKGRPSQNEDAEIHDIFGWTDLDIWIMNSDNVKGNGLQKQLTFNPNKDFYPIWIP